MTLAVELPDLRGWAAQVSRAGADSTGLSGYAATYVPDGDFGRILEVITGDYESMIPQVQAVLSQDGRRLTETGAALTAIAQDFANVDAQVAKNFDARAPVVHYGCPTGFGDADRAFPLPAPASSGHTLPSVSFGFPWNQLCDLMASIGGPDPRVHVTRWITGDIDKAARQAAAWELTAGGLRGVASNLAVGAERINRTWEGRTATRSASHSGRWIRSLEEQADGMDQIGAHVRDMVAQALDLAQCVVDIFKFMLSIATAAWAKAYIPIYGQVELIETVWDLIRMVKRAMKAIGVFTAALVAIKNAILMVAHSFDVQRLPVAPA